jgi:hypothetical protein
MRDDAEGELRHEVVNRVVPLARIARGEPARRAKRLSMILLEGLYAAKRAGQPGADAAGFRTAL